MQSGSAAQYLAIDNIDDFSIGQPLNVLFFLAFDANGSDTFNRRHQSFRLRFFDSPVSGTFTDLQIFRNAPHGNFFPYR